MPEPIPPLTDHQLADIRAYLEGCKGADLADVPANLRRYEGWLMDADGRALRLLAETDRLRAAARSAAVLLRATADRPSSRTVLLAAASGLDDITKESR